MKRILIHVVVLVCALAPALFALDLTAPSKAELHKRARSTLLKSIEKGDFQRAGDALDYLKSETKEGAPLTEKEEYLVDFIIGRYEEGIRLFADYNRRVIDSTYKQKAPIRESADDALEKHLRKNYDFLNRNVIDSLVQVINASEISSEQKELFAVLSYIDLAVNFDIHFMPGRRFYFSMLIADSTCADIFLMRAKNFIDHYPYSEHTRYLKDQVVPAIEATIEEQQRIKKDPWTYKYYSGGLGVYLGSWMGFIAGTDVLESNMKFPIMFEASLQVWRISASFLYTSGLLTYASYLERSRFLDKTADESYGVNIGYTVFDSRFLKVEPFLGYGKYYFLNVVDQRDDWRCSECSSNVVSLGANADFRFFMTRPTEILGASFAFTLRFKYMAQFGNFYDDCSSSKKTYDEGFIVNTFGLTLGVYLW